MSNLRIRSLRLAKGLTLAELASASQVSAGMLSQVERGLTDPSLETLRQIARVFSVPLFELFTDPVDMSTVSVTRKGEHIEISSPATAIRYGRLSAPGRNLEVLHGRLAPGGVSSSAVRSHPAEECIVVLAGTLHVDFKESQITLGPGDSAHYDSRIPHRMMNTGEQEAEFIISVTPPSH
ncbi:helix-turn-helix domain-containing protein [Arthrobacter sp. HMWF013]|uniref:helix-turn-helix domain-containing protein n=1 Tax=Arthrobacter sp. HMWF013 TaxID=2056849 RepID=UPI000D345CE3|nr:XRE family transcriptional regulator [Arthrobacter sp. HMWF013]PTT70404.1 XRE family transcriptional regulator [Arthrobacter sp. HMWF013]